MDLGLTSLVSAALERCARLDEDAREGALRGLGRALAAVHAPADDLEPALQRLLSMGAGLGQPWSRSRAFADACDTIASSRLPQARRGALLEQALRLAEERATDVERVDCARAAIEAMIAARWDERVGELLAALARTAADIFDEKQRSRALFLISTAMAKAADCERALAELERLPSSATRGRCLALVASELCIESRGDEAAALMERALGEIRAAPESIDQALAVRTAMGALLETGLEAPSVDLLDLGLDVIDGMRDARFRTDALLGVIEALRATTLDTPRLPAFLRRLGHSIEALPDPDLRARALGDLAVSLAALGEVEACSRAFGALIDAAAARDAADLVDTVDDLPSALPLPQILAALGEADVAPEELQVFAQRSLDRLTGVAHASRVAALLGQLTRFLASPVLSYEGRVALFDRALIVARSIPAADERVQAATAIANGLSIAGAMERGDALFAGLALGIEGRLARTARLERALTLVRLNRTADALTEIEAATGTEGADSPEGMEEIAQATARCGFVADVLVWLTRVDPGRQSILRAQLADILAESTHLDPNLRVLGLEKLAKGAEPAAAATIACLIAQVRLLEALGDPLEVLSSACELTAALEDKNMEAIFQQQLVSAAAERALRDASAPARPA